MSKFSSDDLNIDQLRVLQNEVSGGNGDGEDHDVAQPQRAPTADPHHSGDTATWFAGQTAPPQQRQPTRPPTHRRPSVDAEQPFALEHARREGPQQGWRKTLHKFGIPVRKSATEIDYDKDVNRINKRLRHPKVVGFASFKGGVGKTALTVCSASTIARLRNKGTVCAVDVDQHGSLALRVKGERPSDVKSFARDVAAGEVESTNDVNSYMLTNFDRLSVLGSSTSPTATPLQSDEYRRTLDVLKRDHIIVAADLDTSAAAPSYEAVMRSLDALVIVCAPSLDSADAAKSLLDWLRHRGLAELVSHSIVLINHQSPATPYLDVDAVKSHFVNNEKLSLIEIPWDEHLAESGPIALDLLNKTTRRRFVEIAALIVDKLPAV